MMKKLIAILILINFYIISFCQIPEIKWQQCFGTIENDKAECILGTENGYMLGITIKTDGSGITNFHGVADAWIVNIDTIGNIIWEKCFGGSEGDVPHKIIKISNNYYYLLNSSNSTDGDVQSQNHGSSDFWIVKIDGVGNIIWERCYGSPTTDYPRDAVATPDGGLLFMGRIFSAGGDVQTHYGAYDIWLCKIDSLGTIEWEKTLGNEEIDNGIALKQITDSTFALIGSFYEEGGMIECQCDTITYNKAVWLVELDMFGDIIRQFCYGGSHYDLGCNFEKIEDGYIVLGYTTSNDGDVSGLHGPTGDPNYSDIWVFRIDEQGEIIWQKCLGGYESEHSRIVTQTEDEGFIVIGNTFSNDGDVSGNHSMPGGFDADIWVVKLSSQGEIEWQHCYGGWGNDRFWGSHTVVKKDDYKYVFAAQTDYVSDDVQCQIHASWDIDSWVFEIEDTSTNRISTQTTDNAIKVYPNPATDYVVFKLPTSVISSNREKFPKIILRNIFGQIVAELPIKNEKTVWDTREVSSGTYFYCLQNGLNAIERGKIVILK